MRIFERFEVLVWFFFEKMSKLGVLIGAQIVVTSAVVDLWVKRTMYPSRASVRMITGARSAFKKL